MLQQFRRALWVMITGGNAQHKMSKIHHGRATLVIIRRNKGNHRTQIVCILIGHVNWTKSHDQLFALYFIVSKVLSLIPDQTTWPTYAFSRTFLPYNQQIFTVFHFFKLHDQLKKHKQPHDWLFFKLFLHHTTNSTTNNFFLVPSTQPTI